MSRRQFTSRPDVSREELENRFRMLLDLYDETHPRGGTSTAEHKDQGAMQALSLAGNLFSDLVGWALRHEIGLVLKGGEPAFRLSPGFDSHDFELIGEDCWKRPRGESCWSGPNANHTVNRLIAAQILQAISLLGPPFFFSHVADALVALNHGETMPILRAETSRRHGATYSLTKARLRAIKYIEYRYHAGDRRGVVAKDVAEALRVSLNTLRDWKRTQLPDALGKERFHLESETAKRAGKLSREKPVFNDKPSIRDGVVQLELWEFQNETLEEIAEEYWSAVSSRK